jgi:hypothetical protein
MDIKSIKDDEMIVVCFLTSLLRTLVIGDLPSRILLHHHGISYDGRLRHTRDWVSPSQPANVQWHGQYET